jgi:hypothetical protein
VAATLVTMLVFPRCTCCNKLLPPAKPQQTPNDDLNDLADVLSGAQVTAAAPAIGQVSQVGVGSYKVDLAVERLKA